MHVARSQLCRQTVTFSVEQQQRVIAGRFKVPVVGTVLLFSIDRDFRAVHVQHYPLGGIHDLRLHQQLSIDSAQTFQVLVLTSRNNGGAKANTAPRSQIFSEPIKRKGGRQLLGIVHIFESCQAAVDGLPQQIRER
jgi:hypothetical protein